MKKQQKIRLRRLLGVLTALLVAAGIAVGVYWVGSLRGWFAPPPVTVETSSGPDRPDPTPVPDRQKHHRQGAGGAWRAVLCDGRGGDPPSGGRGEPCRGRGR